MSIYEYNLVDVWFELWLHVNVRGESIELIMVHWEVNYWTSEIQLLNKHASFSYQYCQIHFYFLV
jgi:hypothetical protein